MSAQYVSTDVKETDNEIVVVVELPGVDDKDISLSLQDGVLTIRGEKRLERDEGNYRMTERSHGNLQCTVRLPDTVDEDMVETSFNHGVLKVRLAKRPKRCA